MYNGILDHFGLEKNNVKTRIPEKIEKNWKVSLEDWRGCKSGSSLCSISAVEPWRNHATINTAEDQRKRRLSNVKSSVNGRSLIPYDRNEGIFVKSLPNPLKDGSSVVSVVRTIWAFCHLHKLLDHAIQAEQPGWGAAVPLFVTVCDRRHHDTSLHYCAGQRRVLWTRILLKFDVGKMRQIQKPQLLTASILHLVSRVDTLPRAGEVLSRHLQHDFLFLIERRFTVVQVMYGYTVIYCYCMTVCYILRPQLVFKVSTEHDHCRSQALQS